MSRAVREGGNCSCSCPDFCLGEWCPEERVSSFPGGVVATSAHIIQTLTDQDAEATVVSIDGVGAHDLISRQAMREGLQEMERDQILPFVGMFYGSSSTYLWERQLPHATLVRIWVAQGRHCGPVVAAQEGLPLP